MKSGSFLQFLLFLLIAGLFAHVMIFNLPVTISSTGALLLFFGAVLIGSWLYWAVGNKGNPNYAQIEPSSAGWRMAFYLIMLSYVALYEVLAFILVKHNPFQAFSIQSMTAEQVLILSLLIAPLIEYFDKG